MGEARLFSGLKTEEAWVDISRWREMHVRTCVYRGFCYMYSPLVSSRVCLFRPRSHGMLLLHSSDPMCSSSTSIPSSSSSFRSPLFTTLFTTSGQTAGWMSAREHVVIGSVEQLLSVVCIHSRTINDKKTVGSFVSKPASDSEEEVPAVQRQDGTTPPPAAVLLVAIDVLFTIYFIQSLL